MCYLEKCHDAPLFRLEISKQVLQQRGVSLITDSLGEEAKTRFAAAATTTLRVDALTARESRIRCCGAAGKTEQARARPGSQVVRLAFARGAGAGCV
jgi:hypothetical protein